jgi:hypothetical protein
MKLCIVYGGCFLMSIILVLFGVVRLGNSKVCTVHKKVVSTTAVNVKDFVFYDAQELATIVKTREERSRLIIESVSGVTYKDVQRNLFLTQLALRAIAILNHHEKQRFEVPYTVHSNGIYKHALVKQVVVNQKKCCGLSALEKILK